MKIFNFSKPEGINAVRLLSYGQLASVLGSGIANTAISLWLWTTYRDIAILSTFALLSFAPIILFSPFAGAIIDRIKIRSALMVSDGGCAAVNFFIFLLLYVHRPDITYLYALTFLQGILFSFQFPAFSKAVTVVMGSEDYSKANAILSLSRSIPSVIAPAIGAAAYIVLGIRSILLIDSLSFIIPLIMLFLINIPVVSENNVKNKFFKDVLFGFTYIFQRPHLSLILGTFFIYNFITAVVAVAQIPILTAMKNGDLLLGWTRSGAALGSVLAGIYLLRSKPKNNKLNIIFYGLGIIYMISYMLPTFTSVGFLWVVCAFCATFFFIIVNNYNQAIWQKKVETVVQGRVFSARILLAQISIPLANISTPLLINFFGEGFKKLSGQPRIMDGIIYSTISPRVTMAFLATIGMLLSISLYIFVRRLSDLENV